MASNTPKDRAAAAAALTRIADFLDVPIAGFYEVAPGSNGGAPADPAQQAEIRELIRQFLRLHDPKARRRCLTYVRRVADESGWPPAAPGARKDALTGFEGS
ncbi:hypothetical protein [Methylobacterium gregans]|uniref:Uncharacterized protein n=1 Tax=Methylobacterium gregans TaxID=374424 RepID=A0AA37MBV3_9HYPH|nr:hypothetical protein [Methylobacterium gregans]MDQ0521133.1 hypothetical protein [Methylobacterium gregans]GJD79139.1 hypothetical protein NBEOAGPD_2360 [Methylobacterium gregans]GLS54298.1 hypothetical protein GCM10007886_24810 [Methylobacterium gregans]